MMMCCASVSWVDTRRVTRWGQALWGCVLFVLAWSACQVLVTLISLPPKLEGESSDALSWGCFLGWASFVALRWYVTFICTILQRPAIKTLHHQWKHWLVVILEKVLWGGIWWYGLGVVWVSYSAGALHGLCAVVQQCPWYAWLIGLLLECLLLWHIMTLARGYGEIAAVRTRRRHGAYRWVKHPQALTDALRMVWGLTLIACFLWQDKEAPTALYWVTYFLAYGCLSYVRSCDEARLMHAFDV
ncbi:MAG: hypothetical protein ACKO37_10080 [Vampirovibrionales bacterium]